MTSVAIDEATIENIRTKWNHAERLTVDCDPKAINAISDIEKLLEQHKDLARYRQYRIIVEDTKIIKNDFADDCVCNKKAW